jgi:hypothetical protein
MVYLSSLSSSGLNSLAVKHYESALDLVAAKMQRDPQVPCVAEGYLSFDLTI